MKLLLIGDPHPKLGKLEEFKGFLQQTLDVIKQESPDQVVLLGDLQDTFGVLRSEILAQWAWFFREAGKMTRLVALVGNHDLAGAEGGTSSLEVFKDFDSVQIVDEPYRTGEFHKVGYEWVSYVPFIRDNKHFEEVMRTIPAGSLVFCHQSFNGAQFENGFYDPHGADPACAAHLGGVISGHIHKDQLIQNIWYPGTPFQHTFGDAGQIKGLYMISLHDGEYNIEKRISLKMPIFVQWEAGSLEELKERMEIALDREGENLALQSYKLIAKASPSEIQMFWQDPVVRKFKQGARRVVDGLTSIKASQKLPGSSGKNLKEKLHEYIKAQDWRSSQDRVLARAEKLLAN